MASWQAHVTSWMLRRTFKPKLAAAKSAMHIRKLMRPRPFTPPRDIRITPEEIGGVPGEWVEGPSSSGLTLLYLHGGGYVACTAETHRPFTSGFAKLGLRVFAADYRLAPEHPFPAAIEDAVAVYRGLLARGITPGKLAVAGDSAGGGLAVALLISLRSAGVRLPFGAVLFSPWTDLAGTGDSVRTNDKRCAMFHGAGMEQAARYYLGSTDRRDPLASPLYANLTGLPRMLIHVGKDELLLDDSTRLADHAQAAGVKVKLKIWPVVPHVWQLVPNIPEAKQSLKEATAFLTSI